MLMCIVQNLVLDWLEWE